LPGLQQKGQKAHAGVTSGKNNIPSQAMRLSPGEVISVIIIIIIINVKKTAECTLLNGE